MEKQLTASKEEQTERQATLRTQGRKGCKQKHISIILTPDNLEFVSIMGSLTGKNRTQFINFVLDAFKEECSDIYNQAQEVIKNLEIAQEVLKDLEADQEALKGIKTAQEAIENLETAQEVLKDLKAAQEALKNLETVREVLKGLKTRAIGEN